MEQSQIFSSLQQFQFETVADICCGVWRGYPVSLHKNTGVYYVDLAIRVEKPNAVKKTIKKALKASSSRVAKLSLVWSKAITFIITFPDSEEPGNRFIQTMEEITGLLSSNNVPPAQTCALSGASNPDSLCLIVAENHISYQPVMGQLIREQNAKVAEKVEDNENNGNYLTGIIGAVLGAVVGIVVNVLIIVFLQRIFAIAFALVPVASMFGYKLLKGKANKAAIVIVVLLSLIAVPVMCVLSYVLFISKELSMSFGEVFPQVMELIQENAEVRSECFTDAPMMLLFMALGIFIAWRYMSGSLNSSVAGVVSAQAASLRPNPDYRVNGRA